MARSFTVMVKLIITDDADPFDVMEEMNYEFTHDGIVSTEIIDCTISDECMG